MRLILLALSVFLIACNNQSELRDERQVDIAFETKTIAAMLQVQSDEWNKGNIEGFMSTYWKSDSMMFIGKSGLRFGWTTTLENYKKSYSSKAEMGILSFDIHQIKILSEEHAYLVGGWHLKRSEELGNLDGFFDLLLEKIGGQWKIVSDHSS